MVRLLDAMGCEHIDLYCDWDATEPNHGADPTRPKNMVDLGHAVVNHQCEFGIGVDGDGDRIGAVDEIGEFIYPDRLIALLADDILSSSEGLNDEARTIVYDVKCSMNVEQAIVKAGGIPLMAKTGHSFMKRVLASMPECQMAAEMSGHIFMADRGWYGFDCSLYNTARLIERWSRIPSASHNGPGFSSVLNQLAPPLPTTGEVKVPCEEGDKQRIISAITHAFSDHEVSTVDGARVRFVDDNHHYIGWYLARQSNTEPVLIMRLEATSEEHLASMLTMVKNRVEPHINLDVLMNAA